MTDHTRTHHRRQWERAVKAQPIQRPPNHHLLKMYASTTQAVLCVQLGVCKWTLSEWLRQARKE